MTTYVSVDIETTGPSVQNHKVVSVGFFIGDSDGNQLESKQFNFSVNWPVKSSVNLCYRHFDKRCWDEFWSKQPSAIIGRYVLDAYDEPDGWSAVREYVNILDAKYADIVFVSDNPSFDIAFIDYKLREFTRRDPMRYTLDGKYRSIKVSDDMFSMLPKLVQLEATERIKKIVIHDHNTVNDAHHNYLQLIEALNWYKLHE